VKKTLPAANKKKIYQEENMRRLAAILCRGTRFSAGDLFPKKVGRMPPAVNWAEIGLLSLDLRDLDFS